MIDIVRGWLFGKPGADPWPATIANDEAHKRAVEFLREAKAKKGVEYDWVASYARDLWEYRRSIYATLDEKADAIIRYLGGGTGLFALGVLAKVDASNAYLVFFALPAVVLALVSLGFAVSTRAPRTATGLPTVRNAMEAYAEEEGATKEHVQASFLAQWNLANEDMRLASGVKAWRLTLATWLYYAALVLLLLPLTVAAFNPPSATH